MSEPPTIWCWPLWRVLRHKYPAWQWDPSRRGKAMRGFFGSTNEEATLESKGAWWCEAPPDGE